MKSTYCMTLTYICCWGRVYTNQTYARFNSNNHWTVVEASHNRTPRIDCLSTNARFKIGTQTLLKQQISSGFMLGTIMLVSKIRLWVRSVKCFQFWKFKPFLSNNAIPSTVYLIGTLHIPMVLVWPCFRTGKKQAQYHKCPWDFFIYIEKA